MNSLDKAIVSCDANGLYSEKELIDIAKRELNGYRNEIKALCSDNLTPGSIAKIKQLLTSVEGIHNKFGRKVY